METTAPIKLKKCSVKLNRLSFTDPQIIQEQILSANRIKKCSVKLHRVNVPKKIKTVTISGYKMKLFCIRIPRLQVARSDVSSPASTDTEIEDSQQQV